eukprot:61537_1
MSSAVLREYLISGYVRELETFMDLVIPNVITSEILSFYPRLAKFDLYNKHKFKLEEDGCIIKGTGGCSGYFIYPESFNTNGYNKGIYVWSIKCHNATSCYRYFGIYSKRKEEYLTLQKSGKGGGYAHSDDELCAHLNGGYRNWKKGQIWTVKLDCNNWKISWYNGKELHHSEPIINTNMSYYFIIQLCASVTSHYEVVETPILET